MKKILAIILLIGVFACSEELTEAEINGMKITEAMEGRGWSSVTVFWNGGVSRAFYNDVNFGIEGSFLQIEGDYYNLAKLVKIDSSGSVLILHFE